MINSRLTKLLVGVLCASIIFSIVPHSFGTNVHADTTINYAGENPASDCSYRSVEEASFTAEVKTTNKWSGHSNIEIKFKNTGTETIHDWYFTFDFNYKIESPFNCRVIENKDNLYTIGNNDWNQDIKPGESVTIGFTASSKNGSDIKDMPTFYLLNTETVTLKSGDLKYKYEEYSNWSSGFNGALILTNKTKETIRDWTITFGANRPITQADSSVLTDNSDGTYTITNDGNNQNIAKGQSYRIGIQGGANDPSKAFELTDFTVTAKKMALKLTDDKDKNGIADVLEVDFNGTVTVTPTETPTSTPTATNTPSVTATPTATNTPTAKPTFTSTPTATVTSTPKATVTTTNTPTVTSKPTATNTSTTKPTISATPTAKPTVTSSPTATPKVTVTNTPTNTPAPTISSTPTPTATISTTPTITITVTPTPTVMPTGIPDDIDYEKDTDKDGLPDDLEDYYGTDKNKKDTDGDGVNDLYELLLETDPLVPDSNGSNDFDNDGLTNAKESQLGTNPKNRDTDMDGLADGAEVNLHGTDPKKYDTDDDGISDAGEIHLGSNPGKKDSDVRRYQTLDFYPKANSKLNGVTRVEIGGSISGYIEENTKIRDISDEDPHTASIEALIGVPVSIETTGDFDSMYIKFYFEEGDFNVDDLRVLWYDEENCQYVVLDPYDCLINFGENSFEVTTNHFSKYMLIDQGAWVKTWSRGMLQAGETSALNSSYTLAGYESRMENLSDRDGDGLPDILEERGMITNIGTVIRTDPDNPDTDGDGLTDGEEMGKMCLTKDAFELGTFQYYIRSWYAGYGFRGDEWVFFRMRSNPLAKDTDGDGAEDGVDKTPNEKNGPINYIIYDKGNMETFETADAYYGYFLRKNIKCQAIPIYSADQFYYFFNNLEYGFSEEEIKLTGVDMEGGLNRNDTIQYSCVEDLIIVFHGWNSIMNIYQVNGVAGARVYAKDFVDKIQIDSTKIKIKTIDCQACKSACYDNDNKSIAIELLKATNAEYVYGATGSLIYVKTRNGLGFNWVNLGIYYMFCFDNNHRIRKEGGKVTFNVMERWDNERIPSVIVDDYPE